MKPKNSKKPKLTDTERYRRFLDVAKKVEASDRPEDFNNALNTLIRHSGMSPLPKPDDS
jgi:hypothetical protein